MKVLKPKTIRVALTIFMVILIYGLSSSFISSPQDEIIGSWILEDDQDYKLEFTLNGTCNEYYENNIVTTYNFSIVTNSCDNFTQQNSIYLKLIDNSDLAITCFEIGKISNNTLSLMIIDKGKMLFFIKQ